MTETDPSTLPPPDDAPELIDASAVDASAFGDDPDDEMRALHVDDEDEPSVGPEMSDEAEAGDEPGVPFDEDLAVHDEPPPARPRSSRRVPRDHVAGVRFRRAGKVYWFDASACLQAGVGEQVIVETIRGRELGRVVIAPGQVQDANLGDLTPIVRVATAADRGGQADLRLREPAALMEARAQIRRQDLPMKAVLAEYNYDGSRLTIYFTSDEMRVDFRNLVRDLARELRSRVMLRQIGPRDQAKLVGGIDRCGRELCCTSWMPEFQPISIRMAKNQGLPLNPSEISGVCGKLLCCLAFEDDQYREMRKGLPKVGAKLTSAVGKGKVIDVNVITRKITIIWETGSRVEVDAEAFAEQQDRLMKAFGGGEVPPEFLPPDARPTAPAAPVEHGPRRFYMQREEEQSRDEGAAFDGASRRPSSSRPPSTGPSADRTPRPVGDDRPSDRPDRPDGSDRRDRAPRPRNDRAPLPRDDRPPRPRGDRAAVPPPPGASEPVRPRRQRRRRRGGGGGGGAPGEGAAT